MRTLLTLRLTRPGLKFLYVLAVWSIGLPWLWTVGSVPVVSDILIAVTMVPGLFGFWLATRVFRGRGEPVAPPRAWWRWTAWPTASWWLAILSAWTLTGLILNTIRAIQTDPPPLGDLLWAGSGILIVSTIGLGYLNSAIRLSGSGMRKPAKERRELLIPPKLG